MSEDLKQEIDNYISNLLVPETTNILLEKFEPYDEEKSDYYKNMQGVYAFFLKEEQNFSNLCFSNNDKIKNKIKKLNEKLKMTNEKLIKNKNLIYIGKTCNDNSFEGRVINGHIKGGKTSLAGKIFHYLTAENSTSYGDKNSDKNMKQNVCVQDNYRMLIKDNVNSYQDLVVAWFNKFTEVKFLPLYNKTEMQDNELKNSDIVISLIEEVLIEVYNPALNKDSKKSKMK